MAIDRNRADRVVIPSEMRTTTDLSCSAPLAATFEDGEIHLRRKVRAPTIELRGARRIAKPSIQTASASTPDLAALIENERNCQRY